MIEDERNHQEIMEAYSQFIQSYDWDFFFTVTFRRERNDGIRAHEHVWSCLKSAGAHRVFIATESGRLTGRIHNHGLFAYKCRPVNSLGCGEMFERLHRSFGRSQVSPCRSPSATAEYCSKYVMKGLRDYDFYGEW